MVLKGKRVMDDKKLFRISDVAKMFRVSTGTLRHYEKAGLLCPEHTDQEPGYRYYSVRQFEVLNTIRYLRALDLPLDEIAEFLHNRDIEVIEEKLERQKELIARKKRELEIIERKIDHRIWQIRDASQSELDVIRKIRLPGCRMVRMQDSLRPKSYLDLEFSIRQLQKDQPETSVFLGKVGIGITLEHLLEGKFDTYDLVFLILDEEDSYQGTTEELQEQMYVTIRFCGGHTEAPDYYRKILTYIRAEHLTITGFSQEITMIDDGITSNPEKFVTEIRIPVDEKRLS